MPEQTPTNRCWPGPGSVGGAPLSVLRLIGFFFGWFQFGNRMTDNMQGIARWPRMRASAVSRWCVVQD
jgi:hypothetical protein